MLREELPMVAILGHGEVLTPLRLQRIARGDIGGQIPIALVCMTSHSVYCGTRSESSMPTGIALATSRRVSAAFSGNLGNNP